jgi:hypothetical protein
LKIQSFPRMSDSNINNDLSQYEVKGGTYGSHTG